MKISRFLTVLFFLFAVQLSAQSLEEGFKAEQDFRTNGMLVLGSWATLNIVGGLAGRANANGSDKYFYEMNAIWNGVNMGIAAFGYFSAMKMEMPQSGLELYKMQNQMDKVLLFNAGLDLGYIAGGFYLAERSKRDGLDNPQRLKGYGQSIILQGAFLLAFDVTMILVHKQFVIGDNMVLSLAALPGVMMARMVF